MIGTKSGLTRKITFGLLAGGVFGWGLSFLGLGQGPTGMVIQLLDILGGLFINSIRMLVVPMVLVSLVCGASAMKDIRKLGRVGGKTLAYYLGTTSIAITIALLMGLLVNPGAGLHLEETGTKDLRFASPQTLSETIKSLIPVNPMEALAQGAMLQIIVFSLFFGIAAASRPQEAAPVMEIFRSLDHIIMRMVILLMHAAPVGVFALMAKTFATVGYAALVPLLKYLLCVYGALAAHMIFTYGGALWVIGRLSPLTFFHNLIPAMTVAFSTSSSNATLPVTIECVEKRCGVSPAIASFALPLGATINMDGTAIMQGVAVIFIAEVYGIHLSLTAFLKVILTATLASIGTAGVPGVGMITLSMVLQSVNLPTQGIALIIGIDRIVDIARTVVNVTGDAVCTVLTAKSEGELDETVFHATNADE